MLRIDRDSWTLCPLEKPQLADLLLTETYHLQKLIFNCPSEFFLGELGLDLFIIGKEIRPSDIVQDRIDLLAADREGEAVIIELKRSHHKLHLLQALSYAGMIAKWKSDDFTSQLDSDQAEALTEFLEVDIEEVNRKQRIILIAEAFDFSVLIAAEWLLEKYGVDVTCCQVALAKDSRTNAEYLSCASVFPNPELAEIARDRGMKAPKGSATSGKWKDWPTALEDVINPSVSDYFRKEVAANRDNYLRKRSLRYELNGKRRFSVSARRKLAYVWQHGRFDEDEKRWREGLSKPENVQPVNGKRCLRFFLYTDADFDFFHNAATINLTTAKWYSLTGLDDEAESDEGSEAE